MRNVAAGSLAKRLGLAEGTRLKSTVLEYCYKNDELGDPMINDYHIFAMGLASKEQLEKIAAYSLKINEILVAFFKEIGVDLIDFKLEYGVTNDGTLVLADEISPDTCRFWDATTGAHLDKDLFRRSLGGEADAYQEVMKRLLG